MGIYGVFRYGSDYQIGRKSLYWVYFLLCLLSLYSILFKGNAIKHQTTKYGRGTGDVPLRPSFTGLTTECQTE
jgi:hypothetical protein